MNDDSTAPYATWVLRLIMGFVLLTHVELNFGGLDPADTDTWLGLPTGVSDFAILLELVVAFLLIIGIFPRAAALAGAGGVLWAIVTARGPAFFFDPAFHWRSPAVWITTLLLISLLGDGALVIAPTTSLHKKEPQK